MASIKERNGKYCVIYKYVAQDGVTRQKWETYKTKKEAENRKKEIEFKQSIGSFTVPTCKKLGELIDEYIVIYGKDKWSLSTYDGNISIINNYIKPLVGDTNISDINTRFMERFYQKLLKTPSVKCANGKRKNSEFVSASVIRDIHKLLRSVFHQAVKWELMEKNPCEYANVPKYKAAKRDIWDAETLMYALSVCDDDMLKLALNLAFAGSLRIGELLGLTWDCVDVSEMAIETGRAYIYINKEVQRVSKSAIEGLEGKDIIAVFPEEKSSCKTVRILKTPKTETSTRKVFLPRSVAESLIEWKKNQDEMIELLGSEYQNFNLVMATSFGMPISGSTIRQALKKLIDEHDLPNIVFHSLRHTSVTYKLKLNGGDIKAVQGDSGHAQVNMVTDVYSHIIDEDRRKNAQLFENAFYKRENLNPQIHESEEGTKTMTIPEGVDAEALMKVLGNPEMAALLTSLAKTMTPKE